MTVRQHARCIAGRSGAASESFRPTSLEEGTRVLERFSLAFADGPVAELEAEIDRIITDIREQGRLGLRHDLT
jgi:hypothetical protein